MDNCFTGRRDWSRQMPEKDVPYILRAGPVTGTSFLSRQRDVIECGVCGRVFKTFLKFSANLSILFYFYIFLLKNLPSCHRQDEMCGMSGQAGWRRQLRSQENCSICKGFTPEQIQQLATPTYREQRAKTRKWFRPPLLPLSWTLHT